MKRSEQRRAFKLEWLLDLLSSAKETDNKNGSLANVDIKTFRNALLMFNDGHESFDEKQTIYFRDVTWGLLPKNFDTCYCFIGAEGEFPVVFCRLRQLSLKDLRGRYLPPTDKFAELSMCGINGKEKFSLSFIIALCSDGRWQYVFPNQQPDEPRKLLIEEHLHKVEIGMGVAFTEQYQWQIAFAAKKNGLSVKIPVSPSNIPAMFRMRDKFTDRRKALKHFVQNHWRTYDYEDDFDIQTYVRDYLRGNLNFSWFGFHCRIIIAPADKKEMKKIILNRELMKIQEPRTDRRKLFASHAR